MSGCALHSYWSLAAILLAVYVVAWVGGWVARRLVAESLAGSTPSVEE